MKYTLYKDDKFIMQRKRFHPLRVYLLKALEMTLRLVLKYLKVVLKMLSHQSLKNVVLNLVLQR